MEEIIKTFPDETMVPERLRGKEIKIKINPEKHTLDFKVNLPDDVTKLEELFIQFALHRYVEELRKDFPFIGQIKSAGIVPVEEYGK